MPPRSYFVQTSARAAERAWWKPLACLVLVAAILGPVGAAFGQAIPRPADDRPELPDFESPDDTPLLLPPLQRPSLPQQQLSVGPGVHVDGYRITGSTVFSGEELAEAVADWAGREIRSEDLILVRNAITNLYVAAGYVNSGAVLPDQDFEGGIIELRVIEGTLGEVRIKGNEQFRDRYLSDRIRRGASAPLNVAELSRELKIIQQDPRIERIAARLAPGSEPGSSILYLEVEEASRFAVDLRASNYEPPSLGGYAGQAEVGVSNLTGFGDNLRGVFTFGEGIQRYDSYFDVPLNRFDTSLTLATRYAKAKVVEEPFDTLDIKSRFQSYQIGLHQPVYQSPSSHVKLGVIADWRDTRTELLGARFDFPGSGSENGRTTATVLRFLFDWVRRDERQVFAARSQVSWGIDALGATVHGSKIEPDAEFVSWLLQLQWARRFSFLDLETVFRTDLQLANSPLLAMEQIAVGGFSTVRGYRQNQVVVDQAVVTSAEVRIPIWRRPDLGGTISLAPFVDYAHAWDQEDRLFNRSRNLASVGIGLRWDMPRFVSARVYWGQDLVDAITTGDIQDHGLQFLVTLSWP
jgi:hemolysin activation/secretion protein